ncbi:MAG: hypothetical protein R3C14_28770 [Caldilineaceae bacterium]
MQLETIERQDLIADGKRIQGLIDDPKTPESAKKIMRQSLQLTLDRLEELRTGATVGRRTKRESWRAEGSFA